MKQTMRIAACMIAAVLIAGTAFGVEPAYRGPFGNPEEPALRPYKWLYRGIKATVYQTVTAFRAGNEDFPIVGSVYATRGLRVGLTEFNRSLWRGATGSAHYDVDYRDTGKAHEIIEDHLILRNVADAVTTLYVMGLMRGSASLRPEAISQTYETTGVNTKTVSSAAIVFGAQKGLDRATPVTEWRSAAERRETRSVRRAQERYIGSRAHENNLRAEGRGNFLRRR